MTKAVVMDAVGSDYIDYWQSLYAAQSRLTTSFGIRVQDGLYSAKTLSAPRFRLQTKEVHGFWQWRRDSRGTATNRYYETVLFPFLIGRLMADLCQFAGLALKSRAALAAENMFLRKQLALYQERKAKRSPTSIALRWTMAGLGSLFAWRDALMIVKPDTFVRWHREAFRLFWRWKSRPSGRPALPKNIRTLIRKMDRENPTWGEERIADELMLKLDIQVSPRTVAKYLDLDRPRAVSNQCWKTCIHNHAKAIVACDFFVSVTATFRVLYVFLAMEVGSRRILHFNVTSHPTAEWTVQQFREFLAFDHPYRFVIHDRDSIFSPGLDAALESMAVRAIRTPVRAPSANAFCERLIGTIRRECLPACRWIRR